MYNKNEKQNPYKQKYADRQVFEGRKEYLKDENKKETKPEPYQRPVDPDVLREKQKQLDYCIYMMMSSYFKKATLENGFIEKNLFLNYQSMKPDKQCQLEEKVIYAIDNYVLKVLNRDVENIEVKVKIKKYKEQLAFYFTGPKFQCIIYGNYVDSYFNKIKLTCITENQKKPEKKNTFSEAVWEDL